MVWLRKLWNLKIPPKVKNFLWHATTNCLPSKSLLRMKRVPVNDMCPSCNSLPETTLHTLVSCPYAQLCWSTVHTQPVRGEFHSFYEWLLLIFNQQKKENILTTVMTCWMIWKHRNELVWNQRRLEISEIVESAKSILNQWNSVQDRTFDRFMAFMNHNDGAERWHTPMTNRVKINADAALFEDTNSFSYAFIARDHEGKLVEAHSRSLRGRPGPDLAEAIGIREALSWVKNNSCDDAIVESDCLQVVQAIRSSISCLSYLGRVVQECRDLLASLSYKNVCFGFIKRSANKVAHFLARNHCSGADRI